MWWFIMFAYHSLSVVGPFDSQEQCVAIRSAVAEAVAKAELYPCMRDK